MEIIIRIVGPDESSRLFSAILEANLHITHGDWWFKSKEIKFATRKNAYKALNFAYQKLITEESGFKHVIYYPSKSKLQFDSSQATILKRL